MKASEYKRNTGTGHGPTGPYVVLSENPELEEELKSMKDYCVSCLQKIGFNVRRFRTSGNYCFTCSGISDRNRNRKTINIKPLP